MSQIIYDYDFDTETLIQESDDGKKISKKKKYNLNKAPQEVKLSIILNKFSNGEKLEDICTGKEWRPRLRIFFSWIDDKDKRQDFLNSIKAHISVRINKLIEGAKKESKIGNLELAAKKEEIKELREEAATLYKEIQFESKNETVIFNIVGEYEESS